MLSLTTYKSKMELIFKSGIPYLHKRSLHVLLLFPDDSTRRLCSTREEDKHIPCSRGKTLAQTKKEQNWCYDPTIKYKLLRQCAVPRYAYCDDSATDWPDSSSSDSETETETMTVEEAQARKDKILAEARQEQPIVYHPYVNYELLKKFKYVDSPDSFASTPSDSETDTPAQVEARKKEYAKNQRHIFSYPSASESETEIEEGWNQEDKLLAGIKDEQLFRYNPNIRYEPLKQYIIPRFAFFDSSSTDWSTSSDSECETETMAEKEVQSCKDKIPAGSVAKDLSSLLQQSFNLNQVNHGATSPAEGSDMVLNRAKGMDLHTAENK